jgi:hypothetical protein
MWSDAVLAVAVGVFGVVCVVIALLMAAETDAPRAGHHRLCLDGEGFDNKAMV